MTTCIVRFEPSGQHVSMPAGSLIIEAAQAATVELNMPCGGQGRCGRCAVVIENGPVRRRSSLRLSEEDLRQGYALACQTVVAGDVTLRVPPQEKIERRLTTDKVAAGVELPIAYQPARDQPMAAVYLDMEPPSLADQTDDWSRVQRALKQHGFDSVTTDLTVMRRLASTLRSADWHVTAILELDSIHRPAGPPYLIDLVPGNHTDRLYGVAIDIGTTSNVVYLVDLTTGRLAAQAADYNGQIRRGEDIISRIVYAGRNGNRSGVDGLAELQGLVLETLNGLVERVSGQARVEAREIVKAVVAGNSTMVHLFLGLPPESIRLAPYVTTVNQPPATTAGQLGLNINPQAPMDCLPGVASYVGADITAGVVSSGLAEAEKLTLFMDIGTNGETVLGNREWLVTCACSAGPAFEGAGVQHGMRATLGAIEEVWINGDTYEPACRVIGEQPPRGICGSGLISLLAELFVTGILDKAGNLNLELPTPRVRVGAHGAEYVVVWGAESGADGGNRDREGQERLADEDIVLTKVDIENLMRAKAAVYAGYTVLCDSVGVDLAAVEQVLIGGAFGQYINVEKAIQIGLLPDLPWERFRFLGNTSVRGAYMALLSRRIRQEMDAVAGKMTYVELSADNTFYNRFTSALFLPHTDIGRFPTVQAVLHEAAQKN